MSRNTRPNTRTEKVNNDIRQAKTCNKKITQLLTELEILIKRGSNKEVISRVSKLKASCEDTRKD